MASTTDSKTPPLPPSDAKDDSSPLVIPKVIYLAYLNYGAIVGLYYLISNLSLNKTLFALVLIFMGQHGTAVVAHRLWAHRTFKATLPLRIYLAFCFTMNFQLDIYNWVRDHRLHHKHSDTEFDPHNAARGFWYSHMGWLCYKKSSKVIEKGKELDLSDLMEDPVVRFHRKYYWYFAPLIAFVLPPVIPWYFWGEDPVACWYTFGMTRCCMALHFTCLVNSAAHLYGNKPYDKNIYPSQHLLTSIASGGEGWHNYHHVFPWDYKAAELGKYLGNFNTMFIDCMAKLGLAYDLKWASKKMIEKRAGRTGDGTWQGEKDVWGWGDKDFREEDMKLANIDYRSVVS